MVAFVGVGEDGAGAGTEEVDEDGVVSGGDCFGGDFHVVVVVGVAVDFLHYSREAEAAFDFVFVL